MRACSSWKVDQISQNTKKLSFTGSIIINFGIIRVAETVVFKDESDNDGEDNEDLESDNYTNNAKDNTSTWCAPVPCRSPTALLD